MDQGPRLSIDYSGLGLKFNTFDTFFHFLNFSLQQFWILININENHETNKFVGEFIYIFHCLRLGLEKAWEGKSISNKLFFQKFARIGNMDRKNV